MKNKILELDIKNMSDANKILFRRRSPLSWTTKSIESHYFYDKHTMLPGENK